MERVAFLVDTSLADGLGVDMDNGKVCRSDRREGIEGTWGDNEINFMAVLHLTLKKKWFDMILSGEKKHEYREYKDYWKRKFIIPGTHPPICKLKYETVVFRNGYSKNSPLMEVELNGILISFGLTKWGGDQNNLQFVLPLGRILRTENV